MASDVILTALLLCLMPTLLSAGVVKRQAEDEQDLEDQPCRTYTLNGLLHLDCANRGLKDLPDDLDYSAQVLLLSNNNFRTFPPQLQNFSRVETLDLSRNYLSHTIPNYLQDWDTLQTLNLSNNLYDTWISNGRKYSIKNLDLSKNKINAIDDRSFTTMPNLHFLDLSENRINDLPPGVFSEAHNLDSLILSRNYFSDVPAFQSPSLRSLHLSSCQIANLNVDSLIGMGSLVEIDLSINQLEEIPDNLASYTLQELNLSYNSINSLTDSSFSSLPHLAVLDLRGNEFRDVWSTSHFSSNPFLREVYVKGNRWSCEGFSVNLLLTYEFLTKEPSKIVDRESLICYTPSNVTQLSWQQAYIRTWHPVEVSTPSFTTIALMVGVIIGIVITSCVCRGLVAVTSEPSRPPPETTQLNLNGSAGQPRVESVILRVPLREDLPPTYDEALLMPRLNSSFHSLPDFVDEEEPRNYRRSRSIGDLTEHRPRLGDRRSMRRPIEIHTRIAIDE
nr:leucine-rich repeat-containing G-protein coupled receptor 5 [Helicoverpa armigera]